MAVSHSEALHYAGSWRDLRRRELVFYGLFLSLMPVEIVVTTLGNDPALPHLAWVILQTTGILWLPAWMAAGVYKNLLKCPRCGNRYSSSVGRAVPANKCSSCGLERGAISN